MRFALALVVLLAVFSSIARTESSRVSAELIETIDANSLVDASAERPVIQSFDVSPDGQTLAILFTAGSSVGAPLSLTAFDIANKRVTRSVELGPSIFPTGGFVPQVLYFDEGRLLAVQDLQTIRVLSREKLDLIRKISSPDPSMAPLFIARSAKTAIAVCAFGKGQRVNPQFHTTPVLVEVLDLANGKKMGEWHSDDVPQAISPDGKLVAVSSTQAKNRVLAMRVVDVNGRTVTELSGQFSFHGSGKPLGRTLAVFVDDNELLLSPDQNIDETGNHSGDALVLGDIRGEKKARNRKIKPVPYGPAGELTASREGSTALAMSLYVPAQYLAREGPLPPASPQLIVMKRRTQFSVTTKIDLRSPGISITGWLENYRPRVSDDGSLIVVAQRNAITIFRVNQD